MLDPNTAFLRFDRDDRRPAEVLDLNLAGLTVQGAVAPVECRFLWVRFGLPDGSADCLALCEVIEARDEMLRLRFKHLFPDSRRALRRALEAETATAAEAAEQA